MTFPVSVDILTLTIGQLQDAEHGQVALAKLAGEVLQKPPEDLTLEEANSATNLALLLLWDEDKSARN